MRQRIDRHGFRPATLGNVIEVGDVPARRTFAGGLARPDPDAVPAELESVASGGRRMKRTEVRLHRLVGTVHDAYAFLITQPGVSLADRHLGVAATHVGLAGEPERRERGTLRGHVELRELHLAGIATLLARIVALRLGVRLFDGRKESGFQPFFRGRQVALKLHMRDIESLAGLIEAEGLGVLG